MTLINTILLMIYIPAKAEGTDNVTQNVNIDTLINTHKLAQDKRESTTIFFATSYELLELYEKTNDPVLKSKIANRLSMADYSIIGSAAKIGDSHIVEKVLYTLKDETDLLKRMLSHVGEDGMTFLDDAAKLGHKTFINDVYSQLKENFSNQFIYSTQLFSTTNKIPISNHFEKYKLHYSI